MQGQADLFVATPAARASDPDTSHEAAEQITRDGSRHQWRKQVAEAVRSYPGRTSRELARSCRIAHEILHKRLPECVTAGVVCKGDARRCLVTGRRTTVWWPA